MLQGYHDKWKYKQEQLFYFTNTPTKQDVGQTVCESGRCWTMTHPPVCLISQQPDTGERGEMERGQSCPQGTFKMPLWADVRQQLLSAKLTKPERDTCCLGGRGLIQEMALPPPTPSYPLTGEGGLNSESACHQEKQKWRSLRSNGTLSGHDVIAAFLRQDGATSGMLDLNRGGPLVFKASQMKRKFHNIQAAGAVWLNRASLQAAV